MKATIQTLNQRVRGIHASRIKVLRHTFPRKVYKYVGIFGPWTSWVTTVNGHIHSSGGTRSSHRWQRNWSINWDTKETMRQVNTLRALGFKVILP